MRAIQPVIPPRRPARARRALAGVLVALAVAPSCATAMRSTASAPLSAGELAELWLEPADLESRDLYGGPGGAAQAPDPAATNTVTGVDVTGNSPGYDVIDPQGRRWKVKLGEEVQPEIVASRLLWAIGFHQPPTYFVSSLQIEGGRPEDRGRPARFRLEEGYRTEAEWSWHENPYVGTPPFKGLLVANLVLNNWDLKASQNRIYVMAAGAPAPARRYVVQDLGAALGKTRWPTGNRNNVEDFESQALVARVDRGLVVFDYHGRHKELFKDLAPADVAWTCRLLARLTDSQWQDAFRAAAYPEPVAARFIAKLKAKTQEGLALERRAANP